LQTKPLPFGKRGRKPVVREEVSVGVILPALDTKGGRRRNGGKCRIESFTRRHRFLAAAAAAAVVVVVGSFIECECWRDRLFWAISTTNCGNNYSWVTFFRDHLWNY
jgi:hypothetical protein